MNTPDAAVPETSGPFINLSTRETRRRTLRTMLKTVLVLFVLWVVVSWVVPLPQDLQAAADQHMQSLPQYRFWTGVVIGLGLIVSGVAGIYQLWKFKAEGVIWLAFSVYAPAFLAFPVATAESAAAAYLGSLGDIVVGMILFLCWTQPDMFEPDADPAPAVATKQPSASSP